MKESIKKLVSTNTSVSRNYKSRIDSYYGVIRLYKIYDMYCVDYGRRIEFADIDEAIDYFFFHAFTSANVGYIQDRLYEKGLLDEDEDLEKPNEVVKKLFKAESVLVNKEAKSLYGIIKPKPFPTKEDAEKEIKKILSVINPETIAQRLREFKRKYSTIEPYISIKAVFDVANEFVKPHQYSQQVNLEDFNRKELEHRIMSGGKDAKFAHVMITVKIKEEYKRFIYDENLTLLEASKI
jgi:hypothetical protein